MVCLPRFTPYLNVEPQLRQARPSSLHWKCAPASVEANLNFTFFLKKRFGAFLVNLVSGATVSTVKPAVGGFASPLKTLSVARTVRECGPSGSAVVVVGLVHGWNAPPSSRHSNRAPSSLRNWKTGVLSLVHPGGAR